MAARELRSRPAMDEGTIGWELRVTSSTTAVLAALTEDGQPIQGELKWDMTK
jgi:hypothetical protein